MQVFQFFIQFGFDKVHFCPRRDSIRQNQLDSNKNKANSSQIETHNTANKKVHKNNKKKSHKDKIKSKNKIK